MPLFAASKEIMHLLFMAATRTVGVGVQYITGEEEKDCLRYVKAPG